MPNSIAYMNGRKKYGRPQAMLFANNSGTIEVDSETNESYYIPLGAEIGSDIYNADYAEYWYEFLILSDDNRGPLDIREQRIERRERMINGRMRSYHIADKLQFSTKWDMLPSRSSDAGPGFNESGSPDTTYTQDLVTKTNFLYTTDGGAGGVELLDWYEKYTGSFFVFLAYDKYSNFGKNQEGYRNLIKYNQVVEVFFSDFNYSIIKRGNNTHDFWNISLSLEEV